MCIAAFSFVLFWDTQRSFFLAQKSIAQFKNDVSVLENNRFVKDKNLGLTNRIRVVLIVPMLNRFVGTFIFHC